MRLLEGLVVGVALVILAGLILFITADGHVAVPPLTFDGIIRPVFVYGATSLICGSILLFLLACFALVFSWSAGIVAGAVARSRNALRVIRGESVAGEC